MGKVRTTASQSGCNCKLQSLTVFTLQVLNLTEFNQPVISFNYIKKTNLGMCSFGHFRAKTSVLIELKFFHSFTQCTKCEEY